MKLLLPEAFRPDEQNVMISLHVKMVEIAKVIDHYV